MGAGKSTQSKKISCEPKTILLSEDEWLGAIYPEEINDFNSYLAYSSRIKPLLKNHVQNILNSGISVVMDFPGNTVNQRLWLKQIASEHDFPHMLIYIKASDKLCLEQIALRKKSNPERAQFDTEEVFHQVNSYFQEPSEQEGLNIKIINRENV